MIPKTEEFKTAMSAVKERIAAAKRGGTRKGYIDYSGCVFVTDEFIAILEDAGNAAEHHGEYTFAYSVAALILVNLAKLADTADDSGGGITMAKWYMGNVLERVANGVEYGSADAEYIFLQSIKDSKNKAFDGWDEYAYELLLPVARLATAKTVSRLYDALDEMSAKLSKAAYSSWYLECDCLVRLAAIMPVDGECAADRFINDNLQYDGIRQIAIIRAMNKADYTYAEKLCRDRIHSERNKGYYWTRAWYDRLFDVYVHKGDKDRQAELAEKLLMDECETKYYDILKDLLIEKNLWAATYPSLLERISQKLPYPSYLSILAKEGELQKMLPVVQANPATVFNYGEMLSKEYPQEIYVLWQDEIFRFAADANKRGHYKEICRRIKKLCDLGGHSEAENMIAALKLKYPRRPAMLEELNGVAAKIQKTEVKRMNKKSLKKAV